MTSAKREFPDEEFLKDSSGDIARLRRMGITDFALMTFFVHVREGQPREQAVRALLNGRSLTRKEKEMARSVLDRIGIK